MALGAFGLQDDINNRYFIRKILEEGTTNEDALANRFSDTRPASRACSNCALCISSDSCVFNGLALAHRSSPRARAAA